MANVKAEVGEFVADMVKEQGYASIQVKDGQVFIFQRSFLQELLDKYPDKKELAMFCKRPTNN
jgi:hypothetical protein